MSKKETNTKQLVFYHSEHFPDEFTPAVKNTPDWYRKIPRKVIISGEHEEQLSVKACVPFLDSLTTGYTINLWTDILVERNEDNEPIIRFKSGRIGARSSLQTDPMPTPTGYEDYHFTWIYGAAIKLPDGYSALYTHPLNRTDLPFYTLSAIIDGDAAIPGGNVPWYLKQGFEGLIPKGTPIIQVIPFKREEWVSKEDKNLVREARDHERKGPHDWYRRLGWKKKSYK